MLEYIYFTTKTGQQGKLNVEAFSHWITTEESDEGELHTLGGKVLYVIDKESIEAQLERYEMRDLGDED